MAWAARSAPARHFAPPDSGTHITPYGSSMETAMLQGLAPVTVLQLVGVWALITVPVLVAVACLIPLLIAAPPALRQTLRPHLWRVVGIAIVEIGILAGAVAAHQADPQHLLPQWLFPLAGLAQIAFVFGVLIRIETRMGTTGFQADEKGSLYGVVPPPC